MASDISFPTVNNSYNYYQTKKVDSNVAVQNKGSLFNNDQNGDTFQRSNSSNPISQDNFFGKQNEQVNQLKKINTDVIEHERQHELAAGSLGSSPSYNYTVGPDGNNYAVAGHVDVQIKKDSDPNKTIQNAEIIKRSALAPASPSKQDYHVANQAENMKTEAEIKIAKKKESNNKNSAKLGSNLNIVG